MRRSQRWPIVGLLVAAIPALVGAAAAQPTEDAVVESFELDDAEALVTACTVPADSALYQTAKGFCLGYMTGAMQLYRAAAASPNVKNFVCPEHGVSRAEMREVFLAWAAANPQRMSEPAIDSLLRAAVAKYPCPS
jgi:Rap1a immunity proteins